MCGDENLVDLSSEKECQAAAIAVGVDYGIADYWIYEPKGCLIKNRKVHWNKSPSGWDKSTGGVKSICKASKCPFEFYIIERHFIFSSYYNLD